VIHHATYLNITCTACACMYLILLLIWSKIVLIHFAVGVSCCKCQYICYWTLCLNYTYCNRTQVHATVSKTQCAVREKKAKHKYTFKYGYVKSVISLEQLLQDYDDKLLKTYENRDMHSHSHSLPNRKSSGYNLRTLGHSLCVNFIKSQLHKKTFINRAIFNDCY